VYCFSAAQNGKDGAEKKQDAVFDGTTTVKWKVRTETRENCTQTSWTFSDQDCGNRVYTNTLDAFLGSAWREEDYCYDSIGSFLKLLGDVGFPVDRLSMAPCAMVDFF
jgi:hypothetical protein